MHRSLARSLAVAATAALALTAATVPSDGAPAPHHARAGSGPVLKADYRFDGNLKSSVKGAPNLRNVGSGNTFVRTRVPGEGRTKVLKFPFMNGVKLNTDGLIPSGRYSVVLTFKLADTGTDGYYRVLNPTLPADDNDNGVYVYGTGMVWYDNTTTSVDGPEGTLAPDKFVEVAFTRAGTGKVRVYVNGQPDITALDSNGQAVIQNHSLRFFVDNSNEEASAGKVARIRVWNDALSAKKVARIYNQGH